MPADLQPVPGDGQGTGAGGQLLAQQLDQRPEPEAFGLDRGDTPCLERHRGDRSDAGGQHVLAERGEQLRQHAPLPGPLQQGHRGGRAGEGHGVHAPRHGGVQQPVHGREVLRGQPPVHGHPQYLGAALPQRLHEPGQRLPVQLNGDPAARHALLQEPVEDLGHGLRGRGPPFRQSGRPHRALDLGPARQQLHRAQPLQQRVTEPPAVGGLDPAPEPDGGGGDDDVRGPVDDPLGRGHQLAVVGERHDPQRRGVQDGGTAPLEQRAQFVGPAGGGHAHGEPGQRAVLAPLPLVAHVAQVVHRSPRSVPFTPTCTVTWRPSLPTPRDGLGSASCHQCYVIPRPG